MRNFIIAIVALFLIWGIPSFYGYDALSIMFNVLEWSTKFILPWVMLYWVIRLVKILDKSK